jgi:C4-dicarboxylate-binding protein DctP
MSYAKRFHLPPVGGLLALALVCCAFCLQASTAGAATAFKMSNQFPPNHHISAGIRVFADKVKEYSKGEMEVQVYEAGALYRDADILKAVRSGSVETGLIPVNKWSGIIPAVDIFDAPFVFSGLDSLVKFLGEAGPILDAAFSKYDAKLLFWVDYGWIQFWNSKHPIKTSADFKGLTLRAYSAGDAETLKALGAAPTIISSSELYMSLQRGTVDGTTTGMPAAVARKVIEVTKYLTIANYATAQFMVQANSKWFNALKPEQQEIIMKASHDAEQYIRSIVQQSEDEAEATVRKAGLEIHVITPEERADLFKATEVVRRDFEKKSGELGKQLVDIAAQVSR